VGAGVTQYHVGDRVFAFVPQGAFAQQVAVAANAVMPMAPGMDFDTAAAITLTYGTSHHAVVDRAQLKAGETMLVLGAAGGVGLAAIEIGKALGARVIAAASTAEKLAVCKEHGADVLINYTTEDLREAIKAATDGKIPDSDLEDRVPIRYQDASNGVVSDSNNHLHFFWLQGEDNLPEEDKDRIQKWKTMNPDWQVNIWDRKLMGGLVSQYPNCEKTWADLCTALDKFPNDRSIVAKVSDFSRLLILYTTHSYNQEWNIYADTDTVPLRSLTKFLRDEYLYGQFWEKFNDPKLNPAEKPWNWEDIDFAVSQENRIDARPFTVTNAVLMGRPKSPVIMDLIKKGIDRRWQPTLKAWGPSMLQENLENSVNQNKGWRTTILPYHYLVYNPGQHHNDPAPSWTLCHHLNSYRWETPGVKGTLTGGLNGPVKNAQIV
jgi:hypothetical protein